MEIDERRNRVRANIQVAAVEEYEAKEQQVTAIDISEYGIQYQRPVDSNQRTGNEVMLTFSLLDRLQPIKVLCWVVQERVEQDHISTHATFMFLPDKDEKTIQSFVALHGPL